MRVHSSTRYAAFAVLMGALACAGNKVRSDEAAGASDTTSVRDTLGGETQNPPGYRGMERDTTMVPGNQRTPTDTFLERQGTGAPQDTAGYSGMERVDTTSRQSQANPQAQTDTSSYGRDTSGVSRDTSYGGDTSGMKSDSSTMDSTRINPSSGVNGLDSTGTSKTGDTTGYNPSQQSRDTTSR